MSKFLDNTGLAYFWGKLKTLLDEKVDAVTGKGLSENDFTDTYKTKLDGIETGANKTIIDSSLSTSSTNPVQNKVVKGALDLKLDIISAESTYAKKTDIAGMYKYKGSVASYANLPSTGNTAGDVWNTEDFGKNYAWDGTKWDDLGGIFEIDAITNSEIDAIVV